MNLLPIGFLLISAYTSIIDPQLTIYTNAVWFIQRCHLFLAIKNTKGKYFKLILASQTMWCAAGVTSRILEKCLGYDSS